MRRHSCAYCIALQRFAIRRRDVVLIEGAEQLAQQHTENDAEREAFSLRALDEQGRRPLPRGPR